MIWSAGLPAPAAQDASSDIKAQIEKAKSLRVANSPDEAQKVFQSLLPQLRSRGPSQDLATVLNNLSDIANSAGDYDQAVALARESTRVCQKLQDKNCEAEARNDAGFAFLNAGKYPEAAEELELALKLAGEGSDPQTAVLILNNLGNVQYYEAKYSEALRTYESAMQYVEKGAGQPWTAFWRQITQANLATLYQRIGNNRRAIAIYQDILESGKAQGLSPRDVAQMHINLGVAFRRLEDIHSTLVNYQQAELAYAREKDADGEIGVLKNRGIVEVMDLRKPQEALKTFDRARARAEKTGNRREVMQTTLYRGEALRQLQRFPEASKELEAALAAAEQLNTVEEQWKALYALGQIAQSQGRADVAEQKFRDAIKRIESLRFKLQLSRLRTDFLADKREVYDALIQLLLDRNDSGAAFEFMERSRARVFQDRFFTGTVAPSLLTVASIQGRLPAGTALVEFWQGKDAVAAVWVTRDSTGIALKKFAPGEVDQLAQLVSSMPENLGSDWKNDFQKISALLPSGIAPLSDVRYPHLLIVPDGFLSMVPFELLPISQGSAVLESHDVTYLPSAILLLRGALQKSAGLGYPWQRQLVAFGDPSVVGSGESSLVGASRGELGRLPSSADEIRAIAGMSAGRAKLFLGPEDVKPSFFDSTRSRAALLHVSTHAVADMDNPERSRLLFSPDQPGEPNNYLFLKELYDLDLRGVDLATLSACDTERGRLVPGEGVQAFSRALLAAGSRSALTTLWRVPDGPTAEFMKQFYYFLLKKHKSKAEALRLTKLEFLRSGTELSHPKYWAAFVLNGDGMDPVPRFIPWQMLLLPLLVVLAAVLVLFQVRAKRRSAETVQGTVNRS
ncbi:MAG: CHAT domain-containing protein [Acidobacteriia bacterium]|nr:CHAT domain-containing protein [Terriglobia bacterium]